jgi:hypothetical protein
MAASKIKIAGMLENQMGIDSIVKHFFYLEEDKNLA